MSQITEPFTAEVPLSILALKALPNVIPGIVFEFDLEKYQFVYVSNAIGRILGYNPAEIINVSFADLYQLIHPNDLQMVARFLENAPTLTPDESNQLEFRALHKNGDYRWLSFQYTLVTSDDETSSKRLVGFCTDISGSKEIQQDLQDTQNFMEKVVTNIPNNIFIYDLVENKITYTNHNFADLGYTAEQAKEQVNFSLVELIHPEDLDIALEGIQRLITSPNNYTAFGEYRIKAANGEWRWFQVNAVVLSRNEEGVPVSFIGTSQDITPRKQLEQELEQQRDFALQLLNSMGQGVVIINKEGYIEYANPAILQMFGYNQFEEIKGKRMTDFTLPEYHPVLLKNREMRFKGISSGYEVVAVTADNTTFDVKVDAVPFYRNGEYAGTISNITDMTQYKNIERELRFQKAFLESQFDASPVGVVAISGKRQWLYYNQAFVQIWNLPEKVVKNRKSRMGMKIATDQLVDPAGFLAKVEYFIQNPTIAGTYELELKDERVLEMYTKSISTKEQDYLGRVWFFTDITERKTQEQKLLKENQYLNALHDISLALINRLNLDDLFNSIVEKTRQILDCERCSIFLADESKSAVILKWGVGILPTSLNKSFEKGFGIAGKVLQTQAPVILDDYYSQENVPEFLSATSSPAFAGAGVPLFDNDELIGVISFSHRDSGRKITNFEIEVMQRFARLASLALHNARSFEKLNFEISERRKAETALQESKQLYQALFEEAEQQARELELLHRVRTALTDATDVTSLVRTAVETIVEVLGYSQVSLYLLDDDHLVLQHHVGYHNVISRFPINQGVSGEMVTSGIPLLVEDVSTHPKFLGAIEGIVSQICVPLFANTTPIGVLNIESTEGQKLTHTDLNLMITLAKHLDQALERARLYTELVTTREKALESSRLKSEFLANMSHEIRTPMNGIIGTLDLLANTPLSPDQQELISISHQSSNLLLTLIDDILDLSKIEAGKLSLEQMEFKPGDVVAESLKLIALKGQEKGLTLNQQIEESGDWIIKGDQLRLRQILLNLLSNAIKFTEKGGVTVRMRCLTETTDTIKLRFEVEDSGIGIAPHHQALLFQPFIQADSSTTRKYGGTGLGLAISQKLVELMHGTIGLESSLGKGSIFWFELEFPLGQKTKHHPNPNIREIHQTPPLTGYRVLLVEDNPTNQKLVVLQLKQLGLEAEVVSEGYKAIKALIKHNYAIVLMDCQMPGMDGYETTRLIRQLETHREIKLGTCNPIPIIAMTANAMPGDKERCLEAGMNDYVTKPLTLQSLKQVLLNWLVPADQREEEIQEIHKETNDAVINYQMLMELRYIPGYDDLAGVFEIIEIFLQDSPKAIEQLIIALREGWAERVNYYAHYLKSSSANLGSKRFSDLCREIEEKGRTGQLESKAEYLAQVPVLYQEFVTALQNYTASIILT
jgi:PAS domain S-box-containing protein